MLGLGSPPGASDIFTKGLPNPVGDAVPREWLFWPGVVLALPALPLTPLVFICAFGGHEWVGLLPLWSVPPLFFGAECLAARLLVIWLRTAAHASGRRKVALARLSKFSAVFATVLGGLITLLAFQCTFWGGCR
jgi:hypothetical protein